MRHGLWCAAALVLRGFRYSLSGFVLGLCDGRSEPHFQGGFAEARVFAGDERGVIDFSAGVGAVGVGDDFARIADIEHAALYDFVEVEFLGAAGFDDTVGGRAGCDPGNRGRNIVSGHRLKEGGRQADGFAVEAEVRELCEKFEELCGADDGVGERGFLDQFFLSDFRAEVTAGRETIGSDNGERDEMFDAGGAAVLDEIGVDVSKKFITAASSHAGEFETSTTTDAPFNTSARPSPVRVLTPELGDAETASWPCACNFVTTFEPMSPVPPITTIFIVITSISNSTWLFFLPVVTC